MNEFDKFEQYITYLSQKLQKPAEFVYDMLLRQVWFEGAWAAVGILAGLAVWFFAWRLYKHLKDAWDDGGEWIPPVVGGVLGLFLVGLNLYNLLQIAINPHWYMVQMVGRIVAGK